MYTYRYVEIFVYTHRSIQRYLKPQLGLFPSGGIRSSCHAGGFRLQFHHCAHAEGAEDDDEAGSCHSFRGRNGHEKPWCKGNGMCSI